MRRSQVETLGTCEWCPHGLVLLRSGAYWCPCEDCHAGGRIQGRKYPDTVTRVTPTTTPVTPTLRQRITEPTSFADGIEAYAEAFSHPERLDTKPDDDDVWVDPIHNI